MKIYDVLFNELANFDLKNYTREEQERRIAICQSCPEYTGDETHKCNICKCNINWSVMFMPNSCPNGKWAGSTTQQSATI